MAAIKRGLGKGLESLLSSTMTSARQDAAAVVSSGMGNTSVNKSPFISGKSIVSVRVEDVIPNPNQPRQKFNEKSLHEMAQSIKDHGVAQPILVRKRGDQYELVAGERRLRASKIAGQPTIPAIIKEMSDEESIELSIIENIQREDLNAVDEAEAYAMLMKKFNFSQEEVAGKVGKARSSIANALRLNDLATEIKESLRNNEISAGHARAILAAVGSEQQTLLWKKVLKEKLSVREAEKFASKKLKEPASVDLKKEQLGESGSKSSALIEVERTLSSHFSTKVSLQGSEQKGKIEINYFSREDLDRVYELLLGENNN